MNLQQIKKRVLPAHIIEAITTIQELVTLELLDKEDRMLFDGCTDDAMMGEYTVTLETGRVFEVLVIVDMERIVFITADEDGVDVMKEFYIKTLQ